MILILWWKKKDNSSFCEEHILHKLSENLHKNNFIIEERLRLVASMLAQSMTDIEIAKQQNVDQPTISRDIKTLKEMSQQFVFDLAECDLAYYHKLSIDGIKAKKEAWKYIKTTTFRLEGS